MRALDALFDESDMDMFEMLLNFVPINLNRVADPSDKGGSSAVQAGIVGWHRRGSARISGFVSNLKMNKV